MGVRLGPEKPVGRSVKWIPLRSAHPQACVLCSWERRQERRRERWWRRGRRRGTGQRRREHRGSDIGNDGGSSTVRFDLAWRRSCLTTANSPPGEAWGGEASASLSCTAAPPPPLNPSGLAERPGAFRGIKRKRKPLGWRALAPCATCPHPETDRLEAKQLRMCLLSRRVVILRQKSKSIFFSTSLFDCWSCRVIAASI